MFTGLIEDVGTIAQLERQSGARRLSIAPKSLRAEGLEVGESISVDGVCLTVTDRSPARFAVLAGPETLSRSTLGDLAPGSLVNLERALVIGGRLGGHMVAGHVDGVGTVAAVRDMGANLEIIEVRAPGSVLRYVVEKGSIAVDGISLTINWVTPDSFAVALIPHTVGNTTLAGKKAGCRVNLEVDVIGKYVEKLLGGYERPWTRH